MTYVTNGAGIKVKVKKECLECGYYTDGHKHYKCCVKSSCPAWSPPRRRTRNDRRKSHSRRRIDSR